MAARLYAFSEKMREWKISSLLIFLSIVPILAGINRVAGIASEIPISEENIRFISSPFPIILHISCATLFCLFGAFQFATEFRRVHLSLHRYLGRILVPCGLLSALTGIWMTVVYDIPIAQQGKILYIARVLVGILMIAAIFLAMKCIFRRDIASHRKWMILAYALGQGAGTQVLLMLPLIMIFGALNGLLRDILMSAGWIINIAIVGIFFFRKSS